MADDDLRPAPPMDEAPKSTNDYVERGVARAKEIQALLDAAQVPRSPITALAMMLVAAEHSVIMGMPVLDGVRVFLEVYEGAEDTLQRRLHEAVFSTLRETVGRVMGLPTDTKPTPH